MASLEESGILFAAAQRHDRDSAIMEAMERRKSGVPFLTAEQSKKNMKKALAKSPSQYY